MELIRFFPAKDVPNNGGKFSHDGHSRRFGSATRFDLLVPRFHFGTFSHGMVDCVIQNMSCHATAGFCDGTDAMFRFPTVATSRRQPERIGQTVRRFETHDVADS